MKIQTVMGATLIAWAVQSSMAGPDSGKTVNESAKAPVVPEAAVEVDSKLVLTNVVPGWLGGIDGTISVHGIDTAVEAGFDEISKNLDMIGAASLEGRHGKLGFILEGIYLRASFGGEAPGSLISSVSVGVEQVLAEGAVTYRFYEDERGWLEALAGARYIYMGSELSLTVDPGGVRDVSEAISDGLVDRASTAARDEVKRQLPGVLARLESELADIKQSAIAEIEGRVEDKIEAIKDQIGDIIDGGIGSGGPGFGDSISGSGEIRDIIREYVSAKVGAEIESARSEASAAVAAARARARREAEKRLDAAEKKLAKAIEKQINDRVPKSPVSGSKGWVDPFVGLRGRYQIWEDWYVTARGDIGGFGVSSELAWNVYGAVGVDLTERTSAEFGYRYLYFDYQSGHVGIDAAMKGPYVGLRIEF